MGVIIGCVEGEISRGHHDLPVRAYYLLDWEGFYDEVYHSQNIDVVITALLSGCFG